MFLGHFAVGFAAKRAAPGASLGTLLLAPLLLDLVWPVFLLLGIERAAIAPGDTAVTPLRFDYYPYSHSLAMATAWAGLAAIVYRWAPGAGRAGARGDARGAAVVGGLVLSHWVFDVVTHRPDLPIAPGSVALCGLGLWNSVAGTVALEAAMFAAGLGVYLAATRPLDRLGTGAFLALAVILSILYVANLLGPPPPDVRAVAVVGLAAWIFPAWGLWIDRHRTPR